MLLGAVACLLVALRIEARERPPMVRSVRLGTLAAITFVVICFNIVLAVVPVCCCLGVMPQ